MRHQPGDVYLGLLCNACNLRNINTNGLTRIEWA